MAPTPDAPPLELLAEKPGHFALVELPTRRIEPGQVRHQVPRRAVITRSEEQRHEIMVHLLAQRARRGEQHRCQEPAVRERLVQHEAVQVELKPPRHVGQSVVVGRRRPQRQGEEEPVDQVDLGKRAPTLALPGLVEKGEVELEPVVGDDDISARKHLVELVQPDSCANRFSRVLFTLRCRGDLPVDPAVWLG